MKGIGERITTVLERSVIPSVVARGGDLRFVAFDDGVVTLEVSGSPGATLPLLSRLEAQLRAAVPEVTDVRLVEPHSTRNIRVARNAPLVQRIRHVLDTEVNPAISAHGGRVTLEGIYGGWVHIRMDGGCQGCSLAEVTLRQGIEPLLRERAPEMVGLRDVTDHSAGSDPYYSPAKR